MFELENRFCTKGINNKIPLATQLILWKMIDDLKEQDIQLDYLQVFKLTNKTGVQAVEHSQEQPEYSYTLTIPLVEPLTTKIFVIDNKDYSTMLLASEY